MYATQQRREVNKTNTRIRKLRKALDLTQQEFANRIGVKRNTVATYEIGRNTPIDAVISNICREFRVNEEWLRTGFGEMFLPPPRDALDDIIAEYKLPREFRAVVDKYLALTPDQQEVVVEYVRSIAIDIVAMDFPAAPPAAKPSEPPPWYPWDVDAAPTPRVPPGYASRAELEAEVNQEVERYRQQLLSEKKRASQALSVKESGAG